MKRQNTGAIVSREMEKPCVTGTKHATAVIKNGEQIRVDGGAGTVKRLATRQTAVRKICVKKEKTEKKSYA